MTSLTIEYGRPIFIDIPNFDPSARRCGPSLALRTVPDPSMSGWRLGSAMRAKILSAGAGDTRSTGSTLLGFVMGEREPKGAGAGRGREPVSRGSPSAGGGFGEFPRTET